MKYKDSNGSWQTIKVKNYGIEQTPIGSMIYYPSLDIPNGYLVCDGSEKLIADYPLLFNAIGYIGGEDVDTGYFRLPDMQGVVPGGFNPNLVGTTNPLAGNFGDKVGAPTYQLTTDEMSRHNHPQSLNDGGSGSGWAGYDWRITDTSRDYSGSDLAQDTSGNKPHSIVQPTMLYHWLIKAKNVVTLGGYTDDFEVKGKLIMPEGKLASSGGAIDMRNSDIVNTNSIWMNDEADSASEGILFLKQGASLGSTNQDDYECLRGYRGKAYYNDKKLQYEPDCASFSLGSNITISKSVTYEGTQIPLYTTKFNIGDTFSLSRNKLYCNKNAVIRISYAFYIALMSDYYILVGKNDKYDYVGGPAPANGLVGCSFIGTELLKVDSGDYITLKLGAPNAYSGITIYGDSKVDVEIIQLL